MARSTNFPNGITSQGVPTIGAGGLLPFTGKYFFVNQTTGLDGNSGSAQSPLQTLDAALGQCTAGANDVVFVTGTISLTATQVWNKNFVHLIGLAAPSANPRARLSSSGSSVFTPFVNVTAQGCIFANLGTFYGFDSASAQICWAEAGQRNFYSNVVFQGGGHATAAAHVGMRSLTIGASGQGENVFENCIIGLDTITRSAANASLEFLGGTPRNIFRSTIFQALTSDAAACHMTAGASAVDRWQTFEDCLFINGVKSSGTTMTVANKANAAPGGMFVLQRCTSIGATKWGDAGFLANSYVDGGAPTAATSGLGVNPS